MLLSHKWLILKAVLWSSQKVSGKNPWKMKFIFSELAGLGLSAASDFFPEVVSWAVFCYLFWWKSVGTIKYYIYFFFQVCAIFFTNRYVLSFFHIYINAWQLQLGYKWKLHGNEKFDNKKSEVTFFYQMFFVPHTCVFNTELSEHWTWTLTLKKGPSTIQTSTKNRTSRHKILAICLMSYEK